MRTSEQLIEWGREPLPQFDEQPVLSADVQIYRQAFVDLNTERQIGMGIGPIPRSKIRQHGEQELGLEDDALENFVAVIVLVDIDYTTRANAVAKPEDPYRSLVTPTDTDGVKRLMQSLVKPAPTLRKRPNG